ncbi:hypothetical protein N7444_006740 [Penicillium canescens]|nr:hypothetical protein N7444_006740 [Penicillium canescens]
MSPTRKEEHAEDFARVDCAQQGPQDWMDGAIVSLNPGTLQRRLMERKRLVEFPWLKVIVGDYS